MFLNAFRSVTVQMSHCTNSNMLCAFLFCQHVFNKYPCGHAYDYIFLVCRVCVFAHSLWGLGPSKNIIEGKTSLPLVRRCTAVIQFKYEHISSYVFSGLVLCVNMHEDPLLIFMFLCTHLNY